MPDIKHTATLQDGRPTCQPLWAAMRDAYCEATDLEPFDTEDIAIGNAAEIRAVAAWIENRQVDEYAVLLPEVREVIDWLTTEAKRAEAGPCQDKDGPLNP